MANMRLFLDTNIYRRTNFDFENAILKKLIGLVADEEVVVLTTDISRLEVSDRIRDVVDLAFAKVKHLAVFKCVADISPIFSRRKDRSEFVSEVEYLLEEYLSFENVSVPVDCGAKIADHFVNRRPPFHEPSKPNEFKDAFIAHALIADQVSNGQRSYIVSDDRGFRDIFNDQPNIECFDSLPSFLDMFAELKDKHLHERVMMSWEDAKQKVESGMKEHISNAWPLDMSELEIEIVDFIDASIVEFDSPNIVSAEPEEGVVRTDFRVSVKVEVSIPTFAYLDKEYIQIDSRSEIVEEEFDSGVTATFWYSSGSLVDIELDFDAEDFIFEFGDDAIDYR